jgi:MFS family permease
LEDRVSEISRTHRIVPSIGALVALAGPGLPVTSLLARLPGAMVFIATLLMVAEATGGVGTAGLVAGALALGQAAGGPLLGRLADRVGHRPVIRATALANAVAIGALALSVGAGAPVYGQAALALAAGATAPPIGPLARIHWIALIRAAQAGAPGARRHRLVSTAMSVEGVLDEVSFVAGPAIAGLLATFVDPAAVLPLAAALVAVFGLRFARHCGVAPVAAGRRARLSVSSLPVLSASLSRAFLSLVSLPSGRLAVPMALMLLQGVIFGSGQTGVAALTAELGRGGLAGLVWAVLGLTSAIVGICTVALPERLDLPLRLRLATLGVTLLSLPLLATGGLAGLTLAIAGLGAAIAPHVITVFSLTARVAPADRAAEAMTKLVSAVIVGAATGAMIAGWLADAYGHRAAFAVTCAAAGLACVIALLLARPRWYGLR